EPDRHTASVSAGGDRTRVLRFALVGRSRRGAAALLLDDVRELVPEEPPSGRGLRRVAAGREGDVSPDRERRRPERSRRGRRLQAGVDPDAAEVVAEASLHVRTGRRVERAPGAALPSEPPRPALRALAVEACVAAAGAPAGGCSATGPDNRGGSHGVRTCADALSSHGSGIPGSRMKNVVPSGSRGGAGTAAWPAKRNAFATVVGIPSRAAACSPAISRKRGSANVPTSV